MRRLRITAVCILSAFIVSLLVSCSSTLQNTGEKDIKAKDLQLSTEKGKNPVGEVKGRITLSYWVPIEGWAYPAIKSYDDCEIIKEIEDYTNIDIRWIHPAVGQENEQFNLMMASNELPDIVERAGWYRGGLSKGVRDGVYLRLNDLIDKHAPNYKSIRGKDPDITRDSVDDEGNICAFYCVSPYEEWAWWGPLLRKDWLEELNLNIPETIHDWYVVLKTFKDKKGIESPLLFPSTGCDWSSIFMSAFDAYNGLFYKDGIVQYGPVQPGMKSYLSEMRKWYSEGLIDRFFAGRDWNQWQQMVVSGKTGAFLQSPDTMIGILKPYDISFQATPYPVIQQGQKVHMRMKSSKVVGIETAVTTTCKYPEEAVKWLDFGYGQKGWELYNYGIEGRTHIKDSNGKPKFWDGSIIYHDPDGIPVTNALWRYKLHWGPFLRDEHNANPILVQNKQAQEIRKFWTETNDGAYWMPPVTLLPEEGSKETAISTQISTYVNEMTVKFIMGVEPIEKFDNYVEQIRKMGLEDMLKMWQNGVERYKKR